MKESKILWIKNNAPLGTTHIRETGEYIYFINPENANTVKVKKPKWMIDK